MTRPRWTTLLTLILVPLLTAGAFLWGTARADTGLRGVQAAIVNNDEMVTVNGQVTPLGRQLAAELADSDRAQNLHWVLATEEKAAEGLRTGRYAAVVTIPEDFSAAATSFSKDPSEAVKATIRVQTSPVAGLNETALGQTIADAAAHALNRFLTTEYLKNIYVGFNDMHTQMLELVDGTARLADGAGQLADGAGQSADGAGQLADGLQQASAGSPQLRDGARQASSGAGQLATGASQLAGGTRVWADGADRYATGVGTYAAGAQQYADGVTQYTGAVNGLLTPLRSALEVVPEWGDWLVRAEESVTTLTDRAIALDARVQRLVEQARAWVDRASALGPDAAGVRKGVDAAAAKAGALASGTASCPDDLSGDACEAYQRGVAAAGSQAASALKGVDADAAALADDAASVQQAGAAVGKLLDDLSATSTELVAWAPRVQAELERLQASIPAGTPRTKAEALALLDQFIAGGQQLDAGGQQLANGAEALAGGAQQLADGARSLAGGTDQLAGGASSLAGGLGQLSGGVDAYTRGIDQAAAGAGQLAGGLDQLAGGAGDLAGGTRTLADGVAEGADKIPTYTDAERDQLSGVVAEPVSTDGLSALVRPDLAWVSLLLVIALWVGALATFAVLPGTRRSEALSTASNGRLLGRALLPGLGIVAVQSVLLAVVGAVALGSTWGEGALLGLVLLVAAGAFALVNHALAALFGNGGRVVALGMALVTAVEATTATAPGLFGALRSLSPLSPALDAVRAVSTGLGVTVPVLVLVGWGILALAASVVAVARTRMVPLAAVARA